MTKRFVVCTDTMTSEQTQAFRDKLNKAGWWHWLPNAWLIKDSIEEHTASSLRDIISSISPAIQCLVLEVKPETWSTRSRNDKGRDMTDWLQSDWDVN